MRSQFNSNNGAQISCPAEAMRPGFSGRSVKASPKRTFFNRFDSGKAKARSVYSFKADFHQRQVELVGENLHQLLLSAGLGRDLLKG